MHTHIIFSGSILNLGSARVWCHQLSLILTAILLLYSNAYATFIAADGKEWRQVTDTATFSFNEVATVCSTTTGACSGSLSNTSRTVDFTGWIWASTQELQNLFAEFSGTTSTYFAEINSSWAPAIIDIDGAAGPDSGAFFSTFNYTSHQKLDGFTRTFRSDLTTLAYFGDILDAVDPTSYDYQRIYNKNRDDKSTAFGFFLYKTTNIPEPNTVFLLSLGLLGLVFQRRRRG